MKIRLEKLTLHNFKCHDFLVLELNGQSAVISGDNGVGKTSVFDALTWLLFGEDSQGRKNVPIKPVTEDAYSRTCVEADFSVDGKPMSLEKCCWEDIVNRGGVLVNVGMRYIHAVNHVNCRKGTFEAEVRKLGPEILLRSLLSPEYFAEKLSWQERRDLLLDLTGVKDAELCQGDPGMMALLPLIEEEGLMPLKTRLLREYRQQTRVQEEYQARTGEYQYLLEVLENMKASQNEGISAYPLKFREGWEEAWRQVRRWLYDRRDELNTKKYYQMADQGNAEIRWHNAEKLSLRKAAGLEKEDLIPGVQIRAGRVTKSGGVEYGCDLLVGGIPYEGLNRAAKVKTGMAVIQALGRHYDLDLPVFLDNAEGVTGLTFGEGSQVIQLAVREGEEKLRMERQ